MLDGVDIFARLIFRFVLAPLMAPPGPHTVRDVGDYEADLHAEHAKRRRVIADLMAKYERDRAERR